jgi:hypothetical protein
MKNKEIYDNFESKELSDIWSKRKFEKGSVKIQSKIVRKGKHALKITINKGDRSEIGDSNSAKSERDELTERTDLWAQEGKQYNYSFSIYIPKKFPIVPTRLVLAQWKQHDEGDKAIIDNPILAIRYVNGKLSIKSQINEERNTLFSTKEEIRGKWIDFVFNIKFTKTKKGFIDIWMNKKQIINYIGATTYPEKYNYPKIGRVFFKIGLYRDKMDKPMTIYLDEYLKKGINEGRV